MVHKLGNYKRPRPPNVPPVSILWKPSDMVEYPAKKINDNIWSVYAQEDINLPAGSVKKIILEFGIKLTLGVVFISLSHHLKNMRCSIENDTISEDTDNVVISIRNNGEDTTIIAGETICYFIYLI